MEVYVFPWWCKGNREKSAIVVVQTNLSQLVGQSEDGDQFTSEVDWTVYCTHFHILP